MTLLWHEAALAGIVKPEGVVSLRQLVALSRAWPDELPAGQGSALVAAGLEGCLDVLAADEAEVWLSEHVRPTIFAFQDHYQGDAALVFWLPSGRHRIKMRGATERYYWRGVGSASRPVGLGRALFGGAECDVQRIVVGEAPDADPDGDAWAGLWISRIS